MERHEEIVLSAAALAADLIHQLHQRDPANPTFEQLGILDGRTTVIEFLKNGELGCALHHLLYMVHEAEIDFPADRLRAVHDLATQIGVRNPYAAESQ